MVFAERLSSRTVHFSRVCACFSSVPPEIISLAAEHSGFCRVSLVLKLRTTPHSVLVVIQVSFIVI